MLVKVYRYEIIKVDTHKAVPGTRMATAEAVRRMDGQLDLQSQLEVDDSEVDADGFYPLEP